MTLQFHSTRHLSHHIIFNQENPHWFFNVENSKQEKWEEQEIKACPHIPH